MPSDKKVLIDTSVWIDYFSAKGGGTEKIVDLLLENDRVATAAVVLAELHQGARSEAEKKKLETYFAPVGRLTSADAHWRMAGELSFTLRRKGWQVNLTDCYIASLASSNDNLVYSLDKHFQWISQAGGCLLFQQR